MPALFQPRRGCACYLSSSYNNKAQRDFLVIFLICPVAGLAGAYWMRSGNGLQVLKVDSEVVVLAQGDGDLAVSVLLLWFLGTMLPRQVALV